MSPDQDGTADPAAAPLRAPDGAPDGAAGGAPAGAPPSAPAPDSTAGPATGLAPRAGSATAASRLRPLVTGIGGPQLARAGAEAGIVLVGAMVVLTVAAALASLSASGVSFASDLRVAVLLLSLGAFGSVGLHLHAGVAGIEEVVGGHVAVVPLTVTLLLVAGWAVLARRARTRAVRADLQAAVLTGAVSGVLLALAALLGSFHSLPVRDAGTASQLVAQLDHVRIGASAWRTGLLGGLLAAVTCAVARLWPERGAVPAALPPAWAPRVLPWAGPLRLAVRYVLTAGALAAVYELVEILVRHDRPHTVAAWAGVLLALPTGAVAVLEAATGTTLHARASTGGDLAHSLRGLSSSLPGNLEGTVERTYGLLHGDGGLRLWLLLLGALVVLAVVAVRSGLRRDPREGAAASWWRTSVVFGAVWVVLAGVTTATASFAVHVRAAGNDSASPLGGRDLSLAVHGSAGPTLLSAVLTALVLGALAGLGAHWLTRAVVGAAPSLVAGAIRLPGGVHPGWAAVLRDGVVARGGRPSEQLTAAAAGDTTAPGVAVEPPAPVAGDPVGHGTPGPSGA